jgi:hypothetical protein
MLLPENQSNLPHREDLQEKILDLSLRDMEMLLGWLKATIKERRKSEIKPEIPLKKGRELIKLLDAGTTTYRLEKVKCGKKKCKCSKGELHGPYWYSYHWDGKKMSSTYIGKKLSDNILIRATHFSESVDVPETKL